MSDDDVFCTNCGTPVRQVSQAPAAASSLAKKKSGGIIAVIIITLLIFCTAVIAGLNVLRNSQSQPTNRAPEIRADDIQGKWVRFKRYKNSDMLCCFMEDGRYVTYKLDREAQDVDKVPVPTVTNETWELIGSDLLVIKGLKGKNQLIKVVFNYDKSEALMIYLDDFRSCGGDVYKCIEKYVRPEEYVEIVIPKE